MLILSNALRRATAPTLLVFATTLAPGTARAQLPPSATIRLTIRDSAAVVGEFILRDSAGIVVRRFEPPANLHVAFGTIERAEYVRGQRRRGAKAFGLAVLIGGGSGAMLGYVGRSKQERCEILCSTRDDVVLGGVIGSLLGGVVGILAARSTTDDWHRFDPRSLDVAATMVPNGQGVGLALRWAP